MLRCSLGTTLAKMGQPGAAVGCLREAIRADPANPLARFELAGVYLTQEHFHDALAELTLLRVSQCPRRDSQCPVHISVGRRNCLKHAVAQQPTFAPGGPLWQNYL